MSQISSADKLQDAVRKLEAFARQVSEAPAVSPLSKTIGLMRGLLRPHAEQQKQNELLTAVEVVNRERLYIQKLQTGDVAEQKLAATLMMVIESYNRHIQESPQEGNAFAKFFSHKLVTTPELPKIQLPQQLTVTLQYPHNAASESTRCAINALKPMALALSKQSTELFHMKVLALLERYGLASNPEARLHVKQSPIYTRIAADDSNTCTLSQTLTLFPGQTIVVMGTSALDPKTKTISRLFPETFSVSLESTQTGFPHASQRTGWALASQLLPDFPQRMDLLDQSAAMFMRKKHARQALLPHGEYFGQAKRLIKLKKQVFMEHQAEFLAEHLGFIKALLQATPVGMSMRAEAVVERFYASVQDSTHAFDALTETHQSMRDLFIVAPYQRVLEAVLKGKSTDLGSHDAGTRFCAIAAIMRQEFDAVYANVLLQRQEEQHACDQLKWDYLLCVGSVLGLAAQPIILQYLSEDLIYEPPQLTTFEKQLQAMAYQQVVDFLDELVLPMNEESIHLDQVYALLKKQMAHDLSFFTADVDLNVPQELATYFQMRFKSLNKL